MTKRSQLRASPIDSETTELQRELNPVARPGLGDDHPLNDIIGTHDGPVWESILESINRNRQEVNKEYSKEIK